MDARTFILLPPCSLLDGALLQIVVANFCSARVKGVLAFLSCLPAAMGVPGVAPFVHSGGAIDLKPLPWDGPLALVLYVDALSVLFAFRGAIIGGSVLRYSIGYMAHASPTRRSFRPQSTRATRAPTRKRNRRLC
jgi:formate hydrogenlyase subunit 3/multisubunit Na+/H+ antiporter MnhD subunit